MSPHWSFERLIAPLTLERFAREYREREALVLARRDPGYYGDLADEAAIDDLIRTGFRSARHGAIAPGASVEILDATRPRGAAPDAPLDLAALYAAYDRGASIRVHQIERLSPRLAALAQDIETRTLCRASINLYGSPPHASALECHHDLQDGFILQVVGSKEWSLYDRPEPLPLHTLPGFGFETLAGARARHVQSDATQAQQRRRAARTAKTVVLEAGDLLYLPRGVYHRASTGDVPSAHLTIALQPVLGLDLLTAAIAQAVHRDGQVRRALPADVLHSTGARDRAARELSGMLHRLADEVDAEAAVDSVLSAFQRSQDAIVVAGARAARPRALTLRSIVAHTPGVLGRVVVEGGRAVLVYQGRSIDAPLAAREALAFIARSPRFTVDAVPGLDADSQRILVEQLLDHGFLQLTSPSSGPARSARELIASGASSDGGR